MPDHISTCTSVASVTNLCDIPSAHFRLAVIIDKALIKLKTEFCSPPRDGDMKLAAQAAKPVNKNTIRTQLSRKVSGRIKNGDNQFLGHDAFICASGASV